MSSCSDTSGTLGMDQYSHYKLIDISNQIMSSAEMTRRSVTSNLRQLQRNMSVGSMSDPLIMPWSFYDSGGWTDTNHQGELIPSIYLSNLLISPQNDSSSDASMVRESSSPCQARWATVQANKRELQVELPEQLEF